MTLPPDSYKHRHIRDPIHGMIGISKEEDDVINTSVFGRLQRIKQMSHTYIVYPSAVHTRFEHSLGAMHVSSRMCDALGISGYDKRIVRLAALLHDVGHGPFSHLFEHVLEKINPGHSHMHEIISGMFITQDPGLDSVLGTNAELINNIIQNEHVDNDDHSLMHSIVSGNLDADKLDYLRRDSYHIGAKYGEYDLERILNTLHKTFGKLPVTSVMRKGVSALENYRLSRYMMHTQVYEHHTRLVAECMFLNAMDHALGDDNVIDQSSLDINSDDFLDYYKTLDDHSLYGLVLNNKHAKLSKELLLDIQERRLLKRATQFKLSDISNPSMRNKLLSPDPSFQQYSKKIINTLPQSLPSHHLIFHKSDIRIKLYGGDDLFYTHRGKNYEISDNSPFSSADTMTWFYVFGPKNVEVRKQINDAVARELDVDPQLISADIR